jgi:hypothetical protein
MLERMPIIRVAVRYQPVIVVPALSKSGRRYESLQCREGMVEEVVGSISTIGRMRKHLAACSRYPWSCS